MQSRNKTKRSSSHSKGETVKRVGVYGPLREYCIPENGMRILYLYRQGTGVVTSDILYKVGSRDEVSGETGVAHMLEHMLFKPTRQDLRKHTEAEAMRFEREVGCTLNATTWKDRTHYFFSYPKEYFERALKLEAERMRDVVLSDKEFLPERTNVLSEFDMYAGDEEFSLSVAMMGSAFHSHPYRHETIGFREDIEGYTVEMLDAFYKKFYAPNNAVLTIVGDVEESTMLRAVERYFGRIKPSKTFVPRKAVLEPKQEGVRRVDVKRPSARNLLGLGVRHPGFPGVGWFETMLAFEILAGGKESILHKRLVDTGRASVVHGSLEPTFDPNLAVIFITLAPGVQHEDIYADVRQIMSGLTIKEIRDRLKKVIAKTLTAEMSARENSLGLVSELVEYISADAHMHFFETERILKEISAKAVLERIHSLFREDHMVIGRFIGIRA